MHVVFSTNEAKCDVDLIEEYAVMLCDVFQRSPVCFLRIQLT